MKTAWLKTLLVFVGLLVAATSCYAQIGPLPCGAVSSITTWRQDLAYQIGQVVILNGVTYQSLTNTNLNQNPCTFSGSQWSNIVGAGPGASLASYNAIGLAPSGKAYVVPSQITGGITDAFAAINAAAATLPAAGGLIDATGLGTGTFTVTTPLTALNTPTKPVTLLLSPGTTFLINTSFATPTNTPASCAVPVGGTGAAGSAIIVPGYNSFAGNFLLGTSARVWDVVCNGDFTGSQETLRLDGVVVQGNSSATVMGALMHLAGVFVPTRIANSGTYQCFAQCLRLDAGTTGTGGPSFGDVIFDNDHFSDTYGVGGSYPGSVVVMDALNAQGGFGNVNFYGGMIEGNGPHNALLVINGRGSVQVSSIGFFGTTFQTAPATPNGFNANVDPIQLIDVSQVLMTNLRVAGNISASQSNLVDISATTSNVSYGINLNQIEAFTGFFTCLVHNSIDGTCETGFPTGLGDTTMPYYTYGQVFPIMRQTNTTPPGGTCINGSIWTNSSGTDTTNTVYQCVGGVYVAFGGGSSPTTPAGSTTQVQFNNAGSFGADATFAFNNSTKILFAQSVEVSSLTSGLCEQPTSGGLLASASGPCGVTTSPLSQFAATTSAQLAGVVSDETGSGSAVFATGSTINPKLINGVSYSSQYPQSDIGQRINACIVDAETRANGNTTGICSSEGEPGLAAGVTTHQPIVVGDVNGDGVDWELPAQCVFNFFGGSFTGSVGSTGITQYSNTKIHSPGGVGQCSFRNNTGSSGNMYALYLAQSSTSNAAGTYAKLDGISFQNGTFSVPVTTASTHDMIVQFMTDNSKFENFNIVDFGSGQIPIQIGGNAGSASSVGSPCCATMFENINVNGEYDTAGILQITGNSTNNSAALVDFVNASLDHPAPGSPVITCTDTLHGVHIAFTHLYNEIQVNSSGQAVPVFVSGTASTANACAEINVHDQEVKNEGSFSIVSGSPLWQTNGTYAGGLLLKGVTIPFRATLPITIVQDNTSAGCTSSPCNINSDANGAFAGYATGGVDAINLADFINLPQLKGSTWLGTASLPGPVQCDGTTTTCTAGIISAAVTASSAWSGIAAGVNTNTGAFTTAGPWTFGAAGAASTPGVFINGVPFTGGTGTTTKPQTYIDGGSSEPTTWSTNGTMLGINVPSGGLTNALDIHSNGGTSVFAVGAGGNTTSSGFFAASGSFRPNSTISTVNCSTSGTVQFTQPFQGSAYKKVVAFANACLGTASYTYPVGFTNTPVIVTTSGPASTVVTSLSATATTITGATTTGNVVYEGW